MGMFHYPIGFEITFSRPHIPRPISGARWTVISRCWGNNGCAFPIWSIIIGCGCRSFPLLSPPFSTLALLRLRAPFCRRAYINVPIPRLGRSTISTLSTPEKFARHRKVCKTVQVQEVRALRGDETLTASSGSMAFNQQQNTWTYVTSAPLSAAFPQLPQRQVFARCTVSSTSSLTTFSYCTTSLGGVQWCA
jgi:hypothetical protein